MDFLKEINHFYYQMSLKELQLMNESDYFHGLSYNSLLYLNIIAEWENCTVSTLADLLNITKSAVTIKVNELVKQGFLVKTQSSTDKRKFHLKLSDHTNEIFYNYDTIFNAIDADMKAIYSPEQIDLFCQMLHTVSSLDWRKKYDESFPVSENLLP